MSNSRYYIQVKDEKIPVIVRNYKRINYIKIFFRENILNISKPKWYSIKKVIKEYEEELYNKYKEINSLENKSIHHYLNYEKMMYKGELFNIVRENNTNKRINVVIDKDRKNIIVSIPNDLKDEIYIRENVNSKIKKLFKEETILIIEERLKFWTKKMNLQYSSLKVNDTSSKYGSCMPKSKKLFFSLRLIMLPIDILDSIIVHELAHLVYPNHSNDFYNYIKKYISDYDNKDKWLKENSSLIVI